MTKDEKADLVIEKDAIYAELIETYRELQPMRQALALVEEKYNLLRNRYKKLDHQLALVDGRLKTITKVTKGTTRKPAELSTDILLKKMSPEEVAALCTKLGLD